MRVSRAMKPTKTLIKAGWRLVTAVHNNCIQGKTTINTAQVLIT